jgi:putative membrane protein
LIVASAIILRKSIKKYKIWYILLLIIWTVVWFLVTGLPVLNLWSGNLTMFVSWAIAIIAMILPGISWSYILVILWQYQEVLWSVVSLTGGDLRALLPIIIFIWWAVVWLLSFAKLLYRIKSRRHDQMVIVLIWFMIWSLNKVRPWKETVETFVDSHGGIHPLVQNNIMPVFSMEVVTAISIALWGVFVVLLLEFLAKKITSPDLS